MTSSSSASSSRASGSSGNLPPIAPQMGYVALPLSPLSLNAATPNTPAPRAPHMGTVSLPPSAPATPLHTTFGLMTPPLSPLDVRRPPSNSVHPLLAYGPGLSVQFNVSRHPQEARLRQPYTPASFQESAFRIPTQGVYVNIVGTHWRILISGQHGVPVTVADVLEKIFRWANHPVTREDSEKIPPQTMNTASQAFAARGGANEGLRRFDVLGSCLRFAGLVGAADGCSWDLYLA